jgi:predicted house-cleaning noncanonical NTP pyrophosphatase (MazG superfamily)
MLVETLRSIRPHFVADVIREFLSLIGTQHCLTLAYSKEENALFERMNKEINRYLRALTFENKSLENYADSLPFVQRILNSNYSDGLKISAAQLLLWQHSRFGSRHLSSSG